MFLVAIVKAAIASDKYSNEYVTTRINNLSPEVQKAPSQAHPAPTC